MAKLTHASLFSGIGGFDLAAEWAGWENAFNCEIDPFCRQILKYHFPNSVQYGDIKTTDFTVWRGKIDVLTGGFPCQPFSTAGKRKGTADNRYLWPEMLRVIGEIRPRWVVGENVLGIVNWDGGLVFEQVHADLETEGYEVQAFVLPACSVGAPHLRYRTWVVAHAIEDSECDGREIGEFVQEGTEFRKFRDVSAGGSDWIHIQKGATPNSSDNGCRTRDGEGREIRERDELPGEQEGREIRCEHNRCDCERITIHANSKRLSEFNSSSKSVKSTFGDNKRSNGEIPNWSNFPTKSPICRGDDGVSGILDPKAVLNGKRVRTETHVGHKWMELTIKAYGNAIVPQVAYRIFNAINKYESL